MLDVGVKTEQNQGQIKGGGQLGQLPWALRSKMARSVDI